MRTWIFTFSFMIALTLLNASTDSAYAGNCGYQKCWGAVGIGDYGAYGYSYGQKSRAAALQVAQNGCGGNCNNIKAFYNSCGAMAVADNDGWGWGYERNIGSAESIAMNYCTDYGPNCQIRVSVCSQ